MKIYKHAQETWSETECLKRSKFAPKDHWGNRPPAGLVNSSSAARPGYGQRVKYNGGCIRNGEFYDGEEIPLPVVPKGWEFVNVSSWGTRIQRSTKDSRI